MRKKFGISVAAALLAVGTAAAVQTPASASDGWLCTTADPTPVYANQDFTGYLFTLSAGRGFRAYMVWGVDSTKIGFYGHGAEHPERNGYVRAQHVPGC
jgi:hypothetical protein